MSFWQSKTKIRYADKLFSEYIRRRDERCQYRVKCYGTHEFKELTCSHFHSRRKESVRFDPQNCDTACRSCHQWVQDTEEGKRWLRDFKLKQLGERQYNYLTLRANTPGKRDDAATLLVVKQLLKEINKSELV